MRHVAVHRGIGLVGLGGGAGRGRVGEAVETTEEGAEVAVRVGDAEAVERVCGVSAGARRYEY